jgi:hypothetical protein
MEPYPMLLTFSWPFPIVSIFGKILLIRKRQYQHTISIHAQFFNLEQAGVSEEQVSGSSLELIVMSWLNAIIQKTPEESGISEQWLIDHRRVRRGQ